MIRNDFVSNSSSSSFIIGESFFTKHFKITAQDFKDALKALGIEHFGHWMCDPKNKKEAKKFFDKWDDLLQGWWARIHPDRDDGMPFNYTNYGKFINTLEGLAKGYDQVTDWIFLEAYRTGNKPEDKRDKLPTDLYRVFLHLKKSYKMMTMSEAAHCDDIIFLCHMDDNEIWGLNGASACRVQDLYDDKGKRKKYYDKDDEKKAKELNLETESTVFERILEIIVKYWVSIGKVNLDDPEFIDYWKIKDDSWMKRDKRYKDRKYWFEGNKPSFYDIIRTFCYAANTHEG